MLLVRVVETSRRVAETTKRRDKIDALAELLRQTPPDEIPIIVPWLAGATRQGRIGIGYATIRDAMGASAAQATLEVADIDRMLEAFAGVQGAGSAARRREVLAAVFARATQAEQQFLTGLLMGELRQGALEGIMVEAVAKAAGLSTARVRQAVMMAGDIAPVARAVLERGEAGLSGYDLQLFRPVQPMLAQSADDVGEALEELGEAALEYKFDGARVQVHRSGDDVVVFSRRLNDVTLAVPEIVDAVRALSARDLILDGEVLTFDAAGRPQPFQVTMRRFGRKLNVGEMRRELPLTPVWFDLLYAEGGSVTDRSQAERFDTLARIVPPDALVPHLITSDRDRAEAFAGEAIARGHEGIMAKARAANYAAGARGLSWLKVKKARTLDLVILAAEWGHGRRQGWLSNLHLGARDTEKGGFAMLGKTFKGLTDDMLAWQTQELLKLEVARDS